MLTGAGELEHLVPQFFASQSAEAKTVYTEGTLALVELVQNLQAGDTYVKKHHKQTTPVAGERIVYNGR